MNLAGYEKGNLWNEKLDLVTWQEDSGLISFTAMGISSILLVPCILADLLADKQ